MKLPRLVPELHVRNLDQSLKFYLEILGFTIEFDRRNDHFAMINLEGSWIMLEQTTTFQAVSDKDFIEKRDWRTGTLDYPFGRGVNFQIEVDNVVDVYEKVMQQGYPIKFPLEERWYQVKNVNVGVKQFLLMDPDGYLLRIQQVIGEKPHSEASMIP